MSRLKGLVISKGSFNKGAVWVWMLIVFGVAGLVPVWGDSAQTLTFRVRGEPETLDWNRAHTAVEAHILMNLMEGLVSIESSLKVSPALAEKWTISSDGKVYTFNLRKGVQWSDGVSLKAEDFVYSWKRLLSPVTSAPYAYFLFDIEGAEAFNQGKLQDFSQVGVKALDEYTLQVKLNQPLAHWIFIPGFWVTFPVRKDKLDEFGGLWDRPGRMVNLGPYSLVSHDLGSKLVMRTNPRYYRPKGNVDQVIALMIKDDAQALALYEKGKLDVLLDLSTVELKEYSKKKDLKIFSQLKTGYLGFVTDQYPLSNVNFRRAIAMAIDKSKIAGIFRGGEKSASSFVPPPLLGASASVGLPFDPVKAKAELAASKVRASQPYKPISLQYVLPDWDISLALGSFIRKELKSNLGIDVTLLPLDNKTFRKHLSLQSYPLFESTWTADYPDPDNFLSMFLSDSGNNLTSWKNEKYDQLVRAARLTSDSLKRKSLYFDLQKILVEQDAVIVPLYYGQNIALISPKVFGLEINPMDYLYLRQVNMNPLK